MKTSGPDIVKSPEQSENAVTSVPGKKDSTLNLTALHHQQEDRQALIGIPGASTRSTPASNPDFNQINTFLGQTKKRRSALEEYPGLEEFVRESKLASIPDPILINLAATVKEFARNQNQGALDTTNVDKLAREIFQNLRGQNGLYGTILGFDSEAVLKDPAMRADFTRMLALLLSEKEGVATEASKALAEKVLTSAHVAYVKGTLYAKSAPTPVVAEVAEDLPRSKKTASYNTSSGDKDLLKNRTYSVSEWGDKNSKKLSNGLVVEADWSWIARVAEERRKENEKKHQEEVSQALAKKSELKTQTNELARELPGDARIKGVDYRVSKETDLAVLEMKLSKEHSAQISSLLGYAETVGLSRGDLIHTAPERREEVQVRVAREMHDLATLCRSMPPELISLVEVTVARGEDIARLERLSSRVEKLSYDAHTDRGSPLSLAAVRALAEERSQNLDLLARHGETFALLEKLEEKGRLHAQQDAQLKSEGKGVLPRTFSGLSKEEITGVLQEFHATKSLDALLSGERSQSQAALLHLSLVSNDAPLALAGLMGTITSSQEREAMIQSYREVYRVEPSVKGVSSVEAQVLTSLIKIGQASGVEWGELAAERAARDGAISGVLLAARVVDKDKLARHHLESARTTTLLLEQIQDKSPAELESAIGKLERIRFESEQNSRIQTAAHIVADLSRDKAFTTLLDTNHKGLASAEHRKADRVLTAYLARMSSADAEASKLLGYGVNPDAFQVALASGQERGTAQYGSLAKSVTDLNVATQGHFIESGTDSKKLFTALHEVGDNRYWAHRLYLDKYGETIENHLEGDLSGFDLDRARAILNGDKLGEKAAEMADALTGMTVSASDAAQVRGILTSFKDENERKLFEERFLSRYGDAKEGVFVSSRMRGQSASVRPGESLESALGRTRLMGIEAESVRAVWGKNDARATAVLLRDELTSVTVDAKAASSLIENFCYDGIYLNKERLDRVRSEYERVGGKGSLDRDLEGLNYTAEKGWLKALVNGDFVEASARKLQRANDKGIFTGDGDLAAEVFTLPQSTIEKVLESRSKGNETEAARLLKEHADFRDSVVTRFEKVSGRKFDDASSMGISKDDYVIVASLRSHGELTETDRLFKAVNAEDFATTSAILEQNATSKDAIVAFAEEFKKTHKRDLRSFVKGEFSGSEWFELSELIDHGRPASIDDKAKALSRRRAFEEPAPSITKLVVAPLLAAPEVIQMGTRYTPWHRTMVRDIDSFFAAYNEAKKTGDLSGDKLLALNAKYDSAVRSANTKREINNLVGDTAANVGTVVVLTAGTVAVTVGTGGAGAAAAVPAWQLYLGYGVATTAVSLSSRTLIKQSFKGNSYNGLSEFSGDLKYAALDGLTVGISRLNPLGGKVADTLFERAGEQALASGKVLMSKGVASASTHEIGRGVVFGTVANRIQFGAVTGAVDGAITAVPMGMLYSGLDKNTWKDGFGQGLARVGMGGVMAAPFGMAGGAIGGSFAHAIPPSTVAKILSRSRIEKEFTPRGIAPSSLSSGDIPDAAIASLKERFDAQGFLTKQDLNDFRVWVTSEEALLAQAKKLNHLEVPPEMLARLKNDGYLDQRSLSTLLGYDKNYYLPSPRTALAQQGTPNIAPSFEVHPGTPVFVAPEREVAQPAKPVETQAQVSKAITKQDTYEKVVAEHLDTLAAERRKFDSEVERKTRELLESLGVDPNATVPKAPVKPENSVEKVIEENLARRNAERQAMDAETKRRTEEFLAKLDVQASAPPPSQTRPRVQVANDAPFNEGPLSKEALGNLLSTGTGTRINTPVNRSGSGRGTDTSSLFGNRTVHGGGAGGGEIPTVSLPPSRGNGRTSPNSGSEYGGPSEGGLPWGNGGGGGGGTATLAKTSEKVVTVASATPVTVKPAPTPRSTVRAQNGALVDNASEVQIGRVSIVEEAAPVMTSTQTPARGGGSGGRRAGGPTSSGAERDQGLTLRVDRDAALDDLRRAARSPERPTPQPQLQRAPLAKPALKPTQVVERDNSQFVQEWERILAREAPVTSPALKPQPVPTPVTRPAPALQPHPTPATRPVPRVQPLPEVALAPAPRLGASMEPVTFTANLTDPAHLAQLNPAHAHAHAAKPLAKQPPTRTHTETGSSGGAGVSSNEEKKKKRGSFDEDGDLIIKDEPFDVTKSKHAKGKDIRKRVAKKNKANENGVVEDDYGSVFTRIEETEIS